MGIFKGILAFFEGIALGLGLIKSNEDKKHGALQQAQRQREETDQALDRANKVKPQTESEAIADMEKGNF